MPFLNCGERSGSGHKCNGDNGPENRRDSEEEQKTNQFVGSGMREAEPFADNQCRYLIDKFDGDYHPCPDPQPCRDLHDGNQPYRAASDKADVRHTVQHGTGLTLSVQFPRQVTIQHITDAAETIDHPECHTCRRKQEKADGPGNSERRDNVWNSLHTSRFLLQPSEIVPAGLHLADVAVLNKALQGLPCLFLTAGPPISLNEVHPDAAIGFRE